MWNFNQNTKFFIHENASDYIVGEMAAILSGEDELMINESQCQTEVDEKEVLS